MKNNKSSGYAVLELNHSGIPDSELKPEEFNEHQKAVLRALPLDRQAPILQGCPVKVIDLASGEEIESFNMKNVVISEYEKTRLASALLDAVRRYYQNPDNVKKYEEWKKKHPEAEDQRKG